MTSYDSLMAGLWQEAPFPRLPTDAPPELTKHVHQVDNPHLVYTIHKASRRHGFQLLVERFESLRCSSGLFLLTKDLVTSTNCDLVAGSTIVMLQPASRVDEDSMGKHHYDDSTFPAPEHSHSISRAVTMPLRHYVFPKGAIAQTLFHLVV